MWPNGDTFIGNWLNHNRHGKGKHIQYDCQNEHIGYWNLGLKHGNFEFMDSTGVVHTEIWNKGNRVNDIRDSY